MIRIEKTNDMALVASVYKDSYVQKAAHDTLLFEPIVHDLVKYNAVYVDNEFCGVLIEIDTNTVDVDIHSLLLRNGIIHSRKIGRQWIKQIFEKPEIMRITANVIEGLEKTVNTLLKIGFSKEGFKKNAFLVNGNLRGLHILGLCREDFK